MFVKVFKRIHDSSIANDFMVRLVFMDFLILADRDGIVDMTPEAFARRTNVPLETVKDCISKLMMPDPGSNTPDHEGKRLIPLTDEKPWGWKIVNYEKYRAIRNSEEMREQTAARVRKFRAKHSKQQEDTKPTRFDDFWKIYPNKVKKEEAKKAWAKIADAEVDSIIADVSYRALTENWTKEGGKYVPYPATYLRAKQWLDETKPPISYPQQQLGLRGGAMIKPGETF